MSEIKMLIQKLADTWGDIKPKLMDVTVSEVNEDESYCIVNSIDGNHNIDGLKVRLSLEICDGEISIPKVDSTIAIAYSNFTEPYMVSGTWLSKKDITIGNQSYVIEEDKQTFNDGSYGGIPIVVDPQSQSSGLLERINILEKDLNELKADLTSIVAASTSLNAALTVLGGTPVPASTLTPFFTLFSSALNSYVGKTLLLTSRNQIENPNILHGKSN